MSASQLLGLGPTSAAAALQPTPAQLPLGQQQAAQAPARLQQLQQMQMQPLGGALQGGQPASALPPAAAALGAAAALAGGGLPAYGLAPGAAAAGAGAGAAGVALLPGEQDLLYVNPRQLAGILRRRGKRQKEEAKRARLVRVCPE